MHQHDYTIADQSGASFLADLNAMAGAIVGSNEGPTEPSVMYAYMPWADTTAGIYKIRNSLNTAWVSVFNLATGALVGQGLGTPASGNLSSCTNIPGAQVTGVVPSATNAGTAATCSDEIGVGQTWQDVLATRAVNTRYTNSTSRPIQVIVELYSASGSAGISLLTDNETLLLARAVLNSTSTNQCISAIIPSGKNYYVSVGGGASLNGWRELR